MSPADYAHLPKAKKSEDLRFNYLRSTAATLLAEARDSVPQIYAVIGLTLQSATRILGKYLARTSVRSSVAILAFENSTAT